MKKRLMHLLFPVLLATLTACSNNTPTRHYYVLDGGDSLPHSERAASTSPATLGVAPVSLSKYLARINITLKTDNMVEISEYHHWAEPLSDGIQRILVENLSAQLGADHLKQFPWRSDEIPDFQLRVHVLDLNKTGDSAVLKANWTIIRRGSAALLAQGQVNYHQSIIGGSYQALVAGYSALLNQLGREIGQQLTIARCVDCPH